MYFKKDISLGVDIPGMYLIEDKRTLASRMRVGTARPPIEIIETVVPLQIDDRAVWRITRVPLRGPEGIRGGGGPDYDCVDLDRPTLAPRQSEHRGQGRAGPGTVTYYRFGADGVQRLNTGGSVAEGIALQAGQRPIVIADGPGAAAIYQAIRWSDDLQLRGYMVDRWHGRESQRLRPIDVSRYVDAGRELRAVALAVRVERAP